MSAYATEATATTPRWTAAAISSGGSHEPKSESMKEKAAVTRGGGSARDVFCDGPLLAAVQDARLFPDCKTFVDMPMKKVQNHVTLLSGLSIPSCFHLTLRAP